MILPVILLFIVTAFAGSDNIEGYVYRENPDQFIQLDVYEDLLWSDCGNFHDPFMNFLGSLTSEGEPVTNYVKAVFHFFPLPYHHNSFFVSQLIPYVYSMHQSSEEVLMFANYILDNRSEFTSKAKELNELEVQQKICKLTSRDLHLFTAEECMNAFSQRTYIADTVKHWKMAAHQGIYGTPMVIMNGQEIHPVESLHEWRDLILPMLYSNSG